MHFSFLEKLGASVLILAWLVWGSIMVGNALVAADATGVDALRVAGAEEPKAAAGQAAAPEADTAMTLLAQASAKDGEKAFGQCKACHTTEKGGKNAVGPNLWDVVGRAKAGGQGFSYSSALAGKGGAWTYEDMNQFLANPKGFAPGTKMTFAGVRKSADRAALIVYLRGLSDSPKPLP
jgi:cytochrome c